MTDTAASTWVQRPTVLDADARVRAATGLVPNGSFDHDKILGGVRMMLEGIGLDPDSEAIRDTPGRVARMFDEVFAGLLVDPTNVLDVLFEEGHEEIVIVRDIPLASMCEHHLVPFIGHAHVGYLPNERGQVTGISKLARLVDLAAKRPNLQERLGSMIADTLERALQPRGVFVMIEAEHACMTIRGVRKPGAMTVTCTVRGQIRDDARTRAEVLQLVSMGRGR